MGGDPSTFFDGLSYLLSIASVYPLGQVTVQF